MLIHLDDDTIAELVAPCDARRAVASAFVAWGEGRAATTQRVRAVLPERGDLPASMASAMAAVVEPYCGGKVYATRSGRFTFVIVLFDVDGRLLCTLDGDVITRLRTPPTSGLSIEHLAVPDAHVAALVGTGRQSWPHLQMLADEMAHLTELRVAGRSPNEVADLVARARALDIPAVAASSINAAVDGAQVVVTVTSATTPLFGADVVGDDTLICAIGATKYDRVEIGADVVARCRAVVCDDVVGSKVECGDLIAAVAVDAFCWDDAVELCDLAAGIVEVPRAGDGPVLFESQGVAISDVALAALAWECHLAQSDDMQPDDMVPGTVSS